MQFPREIVPPIGTTRNLYEIRFLDPILAARRVSERSLMPLIVARPGSGLPSHAEATEEQRGGQPRRRDCRRVMARTVLLDTRSGPDRRGGQRREGEAAFNIDVRV